MTQEVQKSVKLDRSSLKIAENEFVEYKKEIFKISSIIDFHEVVGINIETKRPKRLEIKYLKPITPENIEMNPAIYKDIDEYSDEEFKEIQQKYSAIQPLLSNDISREEIEQHAEKIGVHFTTLYRWLRKYKSTGTLTGLLPKPSGRKKGETRLDFMTEDVTQEVINNYYLTRQRPSVQSVINKINIECKNRGIIAPSKNTIRNRIHKLSEYDILKKQGNRSIARTKFEPVPGSFEAEYPMQLIQIDHTPVDLILVDDDTREPIGRPYITVAIDVYSRMIVGYYLTLSPPSSTSVALCITNTVLSKEKTLLELDIEADWNVWGFPETIHVDNGADFRAEALRTAGLAHGINIEFRPVGKSNFGGHVERVIGTLMKAAHEIPGTTFSSIHERQEYDSNKNSSMTFKEFEKWLVTFITKIYHKRKHEGIGMSPEQLWEKGIFGEESSVGLLPKPTDSVSVTIDFLPIFHRTIQKNGVNIEGLNYYDHLLRSKINMMEEGTNRKKKFIFKRDPRDIKYVWFYDNVLQEYFKINVADQNMPNMTLWEYELIRKKLHEDGTTQINTAQIIEAHEELHKQIEDSTNRTKKARRLKQRLKNKDTEISTTQEILATKPLPANSYVDEAIWDDDIPDFD
ncbi:MAG: DDE-type integrase/transposase/recombinase [Sulfurimonas sp.]|uniref:Mu transposase C-terminal domain-containing protein n=1 Tax=Sulfurimonas sp. TaxID=2022749 RepID=UPI00261979D7|nr:DDE-type integrase/transposase/recombinase [Sulfurimonas sp.]MDD5401114.1 DDE-type integrase/transposase/recombinase [Sulfurimonas sp.]